MKRKQNNDMVIRGALALAFWLHAFLSVAQVEVNVVVSAAPPANLFEWGERREVLNVLIRPQAGQVFSCKVKVEVATADGTLVMATDLNRAPVYNFAGSSNVLLTAADLFSLSMMNISPTYQKKLERTGNLPSGTYQLCVQVLRLPDLGPASQKVCRNFFLAAMQLPILMMPADGQELEEKLAQSAILFRWTPLTPRLAAAPNYRIQVFEVLERQSPLQALRSNQPLLDRIISATTQYIWQPQLGMPAGADSLGASRQFVWTLQTLDGQGQPVNSSDGNGEGRSEPKTFRIVTRKLPQ